MTLVDSNSCPLEIQAVLPGVSASVEGGAGMQNRVVSLLREKS